MVTMVNPVLTIPCRLAPFFPPKIYGRLLDSLLNSYRQDLKTKIQVLYNYVIMNCMVMQFTD